MLTGAVLLVIVLALAVLAYLTIEAGRYWRPSNIWIARASVYPTLAICLVLGGHLAFTGQALAADAARPVADLRPLWGYGVEIAGGLLTVLGGFATRRVSKYLGLKEQDLARTCLDMALMRAIQYAMEVAIQRGESVAQVEVRNRLVAVAATYAARAVPDTLRLFGIDRAGLEERLRARLPEIVPHPDQPVAFGHLATTGA